MPPTTNNCLYYTQTPLSPVLTPRGAFEISRSRGASWTDAASRSPPKRPKERSWQQPPEALECRRTGDAPELPARLLPTTRVRDPDGSATTRGPSSGTGPYDD